MSHDDGGICLIRLADLQNEAIVAAVHRDMRRNYYASFDWSVPFYAAAAYEGFIATAQDWGGGGERSVALLPEIQRAYCVLDWAKLHVSRKARKRSAHYDLTVDQQLDRVLDGIRRHHVDADDGSSNSWVIPPYEELVRTMLGVNAAIPQASGRGVAMRLHSVELIHRASGKLVGGEIGYSIGATYTSLTGFFDNRPRDGAATQRPEFDGAGTVQLVALASLLRNSGYEFWNLGHPPREATATKPACMLYKRDLGGCVISRAEFLRRWKASRDSAPAAELSCTTPTTVRCILEGARPSAERGSGEEVGR
jgi:hypothetical protein